MMSKLALLVIFCVAAVARVTATADMPLPVVLATPESARPTTAGQAVDMAASQLTAQRLRKIWPGEDVATISTEVADTNEDGNALMSRLNNKYNVYDRFNPVIDLGRRRDIPLSGPVDAPVAEPETTNVQEDYKTVYNAANKGNFDANIDNPEALDSMLGSLWGKRFGYVSEEAKSEAARKENVIVMRVTPVSAERISQRLSTDGSVDKFVAVADDKADVEVAEQDGLRLPLPKLVAPFKPSMQWYGPSVYGAALDVTDVNLPNATNARVPNNPPKPPTASFVFPDFNTTAKLGDNESPVIIMETIRVTKEGNGDGLGLSEKPFTPIMGKPVNAPKLAPIVGF